MSAPQRPADAEPWTQRPPGSAPARPPPRSRRPRVAVAASVALVLVGVVGWAVVRDGSQAPSADRVPGGGQQADAADPAVGDDRGDDETASQADDEVDAELARLRASDRYLALAEHERAREVEWPGGMDGAWGGFSRAGYANTEALWDEVVAPIRDDALLAGEPYTEPMWNEDHPVAAFIPTAWSHGQTQRGDVFMFAFHFLDESSGEPVERLHAVVIRRDSQGDGTLAQRMEPFDLRRADAAGALAAGDLADRRTWEWVQRQPTGEYVR